MGTKKIIEEASKPEFYTRVSFIALKAAQNVAAEAGNTENHENRVAYANRIFRGEENALLLTLHVVSANGTISAALENSGGDAVPDGDIEFVLSTIWDARANAFSPPTIVAQE